MKQRRNKYSIRKFSVGALSILIASLLFLGGGSAHAAEKAEQQGDSTTGSTTQTTGEQAVQDSESTPNTSQSSQQETPQDSDATDHDDSLHNNTPQTDDAHTSSQDTPDNASTDQPKDNDASNDATQNDASQSTDDASRTNDHANQTPSQGQSNDDADMRADNDDTQVQSDNNDVAQDDQADENEGQADASDDHQDKMQQDDQENTDANAKDDDVPAKQHSQDTQDGDKVDHTADQSDDDAETQQADDAKRDVDTTDKASATSSHSSDQAMTSTRDDAQSDDEKHATDDHNQDSAKHASDDQAQNTHATEPSDQSAQTTQDKDDDTNDAAQATSKMTAHQDTDDADKKKQIDPDFSAVDSETLDKQDQSEDEKKDKDDKEGLKTLKDNAVATQSNNKTKTRDAEEVKDQPDKKADQQHYKNKEPIVLVHGLSGYTDDIKPDVLEHYWGGDKADITQDLEQHGYKTYEASVSAFGSNYDRAVELYYYLKGGTVDYGAAHAEKYGHERYGKTYEGVYKDWEPGKKVHLVGHSMGGQTIRQLEELLRNGNKEEQEYQKEHGGDISPLYQGDHDNMISSITTLATPHNGSHGSDKLGNEALIRQVVYDYAKWTGGKDTKQDLGLGQWGLKQRDGESFNDYLKRVKQNDKLWKSKDNAFYDLSLAGASKINQNTSMNPNISYKTYTGSASHRSLGGRYKSDLNMMFLLSITGNVIGKVNEKEWRDNDGLVSVISGLHPFNQPHVDASDKDKKGVWQVTPVMKGWDHADFVGQDYSDTKRSAQELKEFYRGIADDLVSIEE
ncbi:YSIRK-type signal peptide-containing protein [Staphylococcus pettenkoferi]|uniref:YSIRK-targeted triacylglycerol lipase n=1 Tax=Staphylococcus pettenkoferi TaxID=170573 RepID=UPI0022737130|nr:YSIRK-type signal peptide-containing protein [Staphylococcus pettenkoferi]MCY1575821.1 YSIRK-type signal peptide-containing protein [Staphylococcus pettenkoferi]MCY1617912.1 YSIRK-type signal peptide-containing protein [Staphylococcus pettenkoferi]